MNEKFTYSLRIGICPDFYAEEKFYDLLEFCKAAQIDDVQFFLNMEEVNQGHLSLEKTKVWLDMIQKFQPRLEEAGISVSLNPWTTVLHADRGRSLNEDQNFTTMADYNGRKAEVVACPLDPEFQDYIKAVYRMYAGLHFSVIWIEDDFRLHNHPPLEWGGCFCELHRKEFEKRIGKEVENLDKVDTERFLSGILSQGSPHPYRKVWLDTARDTMCGFAALLGEAVHEVSPHTRVGLMSSGPEVHCVEGRDWNGIFNGLSGETMPLNRPHLPAYAEASPRQYALDFQKTTKLSAAMTKGQAQLWPELDNFPHTTFSKSHRFTRLEMESALAVGADGITMNLFDMIGNGVNGAQKYDELLRLAKPYLNGVTGLHLKVSEERGICVMYSSNSSYTIHTDGTRSLSAIQPWETFWAEYLSAFGIANHYCDDCSGTGEIMAVCGQYFRNLTPAEIEKMFDNNILLLEGEAVETLVDMGLGWLLGISSCEWYPANTGKHSYEQVLATRRFQNLPEARISAQTMGETGDYLKITYTEETHHTISVLKAPDGSEAGEGVVYVTDRAVILPYGHMRDRHNFLLNPVRQEMLTSLILSMKEVRQPVVIENCPYVTVSHFSREGQEVLLLSNYATDDYENVKIDLTFSVKEAFEISREDGTLTGLDVEKRKDGILLPVVLEHMTSRCIVLNS